MSFVEWRCQRLAAENLVAGLAACCQHHVAAQSILHASFVLHVSRPARNGLTSNKLAFIVSGAFASRTASFSCWSILKGGCASQPVFAWQGAASMSLSCSWMVPIRNSFEWKKSSLGLDAQFAVQRAENWHLHSCWAVLGLCTLVAFWIEALSARWLCLQQTGAYPALQLPSFHDTVIHRMSALGATGQ